MIVDSILTFLTFRYPQCRLIQWARWARGPQASGGPQTADALIFSFREISVTNCVYFSLAK